VRISTRLYWISAGTVAALVLMLPFMARTFVEFRNAKVRFFLADQIQELAFQRASLRDQYLLHRESRVQALWDQNRNASSERLRHARELFKSDAEQKALARMNWGLEATASLFHRIVAGSERLASTETPLPLLEELDKRLTSQLLVKDVAVREETAALRDSQRTRVDLAFQRLAIALAIVAVSMCVLIFASSIHIARLIARRLVALHAGVQSVADGHLDSRIPIEGSDEFAELAHSVNTMSDRLQDFTHQLHAETRKRIEAVSMRDSEARFRAWFDLPLIGICMLYPNRAWMEVNGHLCAMLGYSREELLARPWAEIIHPEDLPSQDFLLERLFAGETEDSSLEIRFLRKDGQVLHAEVASGCVFRPDDSADYAVTLVKDLSGVKRAEAEKEKLQAQLYQAQKMDSLGSLAGGVAHNMNNVLAAILGVASARLEMEPGETPRAQAMEIIVQAAVRGRDLVKGLLSFARQGLAETAILDLNVLLQEEMNLLELTIPSRIHLHLDLAPSVLPVKGDGNALTHALMNLCVNAVDAMPETGILCLRSRNIDRSMVEVQVEDSGSGMAKEVLDRAMDPFFTTKEVGKGTGLGLSLVYSIVKSHGGTMDIESEPGRGTRVSLRIPACREAPDFPKAPPEPFPGEAPRYLQVLLVDDDPLLQASTRLLLEFLGHTVRVVSSGEAAMAELRAGLPCDLVILDMNMPGWGGAETLPRIRGLRPDLPVILATGRVDQTALDLVAGHPHVSMMAKPFALDDLRSQPEDAGPA